LIEKLTIGSRGSKLALWQANWVMSRLQTLFPELQIEISVISTKGDRVLDVSLPKLGEQGKGLFTRELEDALFERRIDIAVHSLKDLPTEMADGLAIGAICEREDVRDALVARQPDTTFATLKPGALLGTSSLRRQAQLRANRTDITIEPMRGNVDTRLRKLDEGQCDAIVLASAGLKRLGYEDRITQYLDPDFVLPAVGQGALAIESRSDDDEVNQALAGLEHRDTRIACEAERAFLRGLGGGCLVPIAAYAEVSDSNLLLRGLVAKPDGSKVLTGNKSAHTRSAAQAGLALAEEMLASGARELLAAG
jgi:hydroxymethylbilane synthase